MIYLCACGFIHTHLYTQVDLMPTLGVQLVAMLRNTNNLLYLVNVVRCESCVYLYDCKIVDGIICIIARLCMYMR
jgi:hypothetical protein